MLQIKNKKNIFILLFFLFLITGCVSKISDTSEVYIPRNGFVPDEETAVKIAEAVLYAIYGETIETQKPFKIALKENKVWIIEGTLPEDTLGGTVYIEIQKKNGAIINLSHGK